MSHPAARFMPLLSLAEFRYTQNSTTVQFPRLWECFPVYRPIRVWAFGAYPVTYVTESKVGNAVPGSAVTAGKLVAGRRDNDTTCLPGPDGRPRHRQRLIIDGSKVPGLASNCITGHFSIAICESCGDVCRVAINKHCPKDAV